jgi:copper chaperone NosL
MSRSKNLRARQTLPIFVLTLAVAMLPAAPATAFDDVTSKPTCAYCGMDRGKFAHSRVLVEYDDGSSFGACSIHCAAVDMALHIDKAPVRIQVGDLNSKQLIDATTAAWVVGGGKMGVMTRRAKWAFAQRSAAEAFVRENGGQVTDFEVAMEAAYQDMYQDTRMIREKRKTMREKKMHQP